MNKSSTTNTAALPSTEEENNHNHEVINKKRPAKSIKAMSAARYPSCLCGSGRCRDLRKSFDDELNPDPLGRHMSYHVSFASGERYTKTKGTAPRDQRLTKTDKKKSIYENCFNRDIKYDTSYYVAALHFPIEVLVYCEGKSEGKEKKPTFPFKEQEMPEMVRAGLTRYLPPMTDAYESKDYYGNSVFFLPPRITVEALDYDQKQRQALEGIRRRNGAPELRPAVAGLPPADDGTASARGPPKIDQAVAVAAATVREADVQEHQEGTYRRKGSPPSVSTFATSVRHQENPQERQRGDCIQGIPTVLEQRDQEEENVKIAARCLSPISQKIQECAGDIFGLGSDPLSADHLLRSREFDLKEPSQLNPTHDFPRLGEFEGILHEWTLKEASNGCAQPSTDGSTKKAKEKFAQDAMNEVERILHLLDQNPPPEPQVPIPENLRGLLCHLTEAARRSIQESFAQSKEQTRAGQMELYNSLIVPIANHIGNGYVELYGRLNSKEELNEESKVNRKRPRGPDGGDDQRHPGGKDDRHPHFKDDEGSSGGNEDNHWPRPGSTDAYKKARQRDYVPPEIRCGGQPCLFSARYRSFSDDESIETEDGSWSIGHANLDQSDHGLQLLAQTCSSAFDCVGFYNGSLAMGFPEDLVSEKFNSSRTKLGASNTNVYVLSNDTQPVLEEVFLVKAEDPDQAYRLLGNASRILNTHGPQSDCIFDAVVLPRVYGKGGFHFQSPGEGAEFVSIKRISKTSLANYDGPECPYREISLLREVADDVHVRRLVEALHDEHYIYIVTPYTPGGSLLFDVLNKRSQDIRYSDKEIKALFKNIMEILVFLKNHNLYHCALTPEYLEFHGNRLFLTRMGLAVHIPREAHRHGPFNVPASPQGTLSFQPPEVHSKTMIMNSASANLWSGSVTLYFLLTGTTPFHFPHPTDPGFRLFLFKGSLEAMINFLKANAENCTRTSGLQRLLAIAEEKGPPGAMELLSDLLEFRPSKRMKLQDAVRAVQAWSSIEATN